MSFTGGTAIANLIYGQVIEKVPYDVEERVTDLAGQVEGITKERLVVVQSIAGNKLLVQPNLVVSIGAGQ